MKQLSKKVSLDVENGYIIANKKRIPLTKRQTQIAKCLFENPTSIKAISKKCKTSENNVRVMICRIRSKIEGVIKTKIDFGYYVE